MLLFREKILKDTVELYELNAKNTLFIIYLFEYLSILRL